MFEFLLCVLLLGEDMRLPQEERGLRLGEVSVRLGKHEDKFLGFSGSPRRGLFSPWRTTSPRQR